MHHQAPSLTEDLPRQAAVAPLHPTAWVTQHGTEERPSSAELLFGEGWMDGWREGGREGGEGDLMIRVYIQTRSKQHSAGVKETKQKVLSSRCQ